MKLAVPKPFTMQGGADGVLLLHGFTGTTADVKPLARKLHQEGFTCHGPMYRGHGEGPQALLDVGPEDWWQDVLEGWQELERLGCETISVVGVSLGGVFTLRLAEERSPAAVVVMSAPVQEKQLEELKERVLDFARAWYQLEKRTPQEQEQLLEGLRMQAMPHLPALRSTIDGTAEALEDITAPALIMTGGEDEQLYQQSGEEITRRIRSKDKELQRFEHAGHILTRSSEKKQVEAATSAFLVEKLSQ
ncbi:alpha/beta hydrolase [Alkalicoccus chagannorensis]|uniref:alpha/beta hydrolase n=1 Tax=Alkalicoccus chagannorensis TaxID=427072 RepID=UPI000406FFE8|nr:alpha/beta fold hydrolase [Alkalicoccus chagannorensis]